MENKILKFIINFGIINLLFINFSLACPICTDVNHKRPTPYFMSNNEPATNPRLDKIKQILESMKSEQ